MHPSALGNTLLYISLAAAVAAVAGLASGRRWAASAWIISLGASVAAAVSLAKALVSSDFRLSYVVNNTSKALAVPYKLAALWAGQEGTNLLWILITLVVVGFLIRRATLDAERDWLWRDAALAVLVMALGLMALLLVHSPFAVAPSTVEDGRGLNPLLENPWMIVHPPVLFVGYSLLFVPLGLALSAWLRRQPEAWLAPGRSWAMWGWILLGAGMMLGGYWAYITLGWGGFWAWDPVENSSLVPWLVATGLLHAYAVQRRGGAAARSCFVLAALTVGAIVYGAYLTRSGVLADFSVHSFQDLGAAYNAIWIGMVVVPLVLAAATYYLRWRHVPAMPLPEPALYLQVGLWLIEAMAAFIWLGMSMPLLSGLVATKPSAVAMSYYNQSQPVLFAASAVALIAFLRPRSKAVWVAAVVLGGLCAGLFLAIAKPELSALARLVLALCAAASGAMVAVASWYGARGWRAGARRQAGAGLAHLGIALLVLGALLSVNGERVHNATVAAGQSVATPFGSLAFGQPSHNHQGRLRLPLSLNGVAREALFYETEMGLMRTPVLFSHWWGDVYAAPETFNQDAPTEHRLQRGKTESIEGVSVLFERFDLGQGHMAGGHGTAGGFRVGAVLKLSKAGKAGSISPALVSSASGLTSEPAEWEGLSFELSSIDVDSKAINLVVTGGSAKAADTGPTATVHITSKPGIWLVWLGTLVLLAGGAVALTKARPEA